MTDVLINQASLVNWLSTIVHWEEMIVLKLFKEFLNGKIFFKSSNIWIYYSQYSNWLFEPN